MASNAITEITIDSHARTVTLRDDTGTVLDEICDSVRRSALRLLWAWPERRDYFGPCGCSAAGALEYTRLAEAATCVLVLHGATIAGPL